MARLKHDLKMRGRTWLVLGVLGMPVGVLIGILATSFLGGPEVVRCVYLP